MTSFPKLFKCNSSGGSQEWSISVEGTVITTVFGQVGGKLQTTTDTIQAGKNLGKANQTSAEEQAVAEAQAKWTKQQKKGYVLTESMAQAGGTSDLIEGGVLPMLAHKYSEQSHKIRYPAFCQPKLDGHRCIAMIDDGKATLWSRTRKPIYSMPHIIKALETQFPGANMVADGELYNHTYHDRFEEITSLIRPDSPKPGHEIVEYHIYDGVTGLVFEDRFKALQDLCLKHPLVLVDTVKVNDNEGLNIYFEWCLNEGYEGAMVRNASGLYVNKRSYDLQKVKSMDDSEYEIVDVVEGRGKLAGHGIFVCKCGTNTFNVKMKGSTDNLKDYWVNPKAYVGRSITVRHQALTSDGIPRFPVGIRFFEPL